MLLLFAMFDKTNLSECSIAGGNHPFISSAFANRMSGTGASDEMALSVCKWMDRHSCHNDSKSEQHATVVMTRQVR
jgi:hypothetical protein